MLLADAVTLGVQVRAFTLVVFRNHANAFPLCATWCALTRMVSLWHFLRVRGPSVHVSERLLNGRISAVAEFSSQQPAGFSAV